MGTPNTAAATKELIESFLKKSREELLQCKTPSVTLLKAELSALTALVFCALFSYDKNSLGGVCVLVRLWVIN